MIKAHEIQGCIALENSFNKVGLDHVVLVKVASTAVVSQLLGLSREQTIDALSLAWVDGQSLRTYRHAPNTGSRKSWAAGDATSRAVRLALMAQRGRDGLPVGADRKDLGLLRCFVPGQGIQISAALWLLRDGERAVQDQLPGGVSRADGGRSRDDAARAAWTSVGKTATDIRKNHDSHARGVPAHHRQERAACESRRPRPLRAVHDRDSAALRQADGSRLRGRCCRRSDSVRASMRCAPKMECVEEPHFTADYHDPGKAVDRELASHAELNDGTVLEETVEYPIGHRRRREEGMPLLVEKFRTNLRRRFGEEQQGEDSRRLSRPRNGSRPCR